MLRGVLGGVLGGGNPHCLIIIPEASEWRADSRCVKAATKLWSPKLSCGSTPFSKSPLSMCFFPTTSPSCYLNRHALPTELGLAASRILGSSILISDREISKILTAVTASLPLFIGARLSTNLNHRLAIEALKMLGREALSAPYLSLPHPVESRVSKSALRSSVPEYLR